MTVAHVGSDTLTGIRTPLCWTRLTAQSVWPTLTNPRYAIDPCGLAHLWEHPNMMGLSQWVATALVIGLPLLVAAIFVVVRVAGARTVGSDHPTRL